MTPNDLLRMAIRPALSILPGRMDSVAAEAMVLACALQESEGKHRRQFGSGPARGFWQFEPIGVRGVLEHPTTADLARGFCLTLSVPVECAYDAIEYNDVLAAGFARLALWRLPAPLPESGAQWADGWKQYIEAWRPGRPREEKWKSNYLDAWRAVR